MSIHCTERTYGRRAGRWRVCTSRQAHAGPTRKRRGLRRGGISSTRRGRRRLRTSLLSHGRSAGRERPREPRSRARGDPELRVRLPCAPHDDQSRAGRRAQGRVRVRPSDRARHSGGRSGSPFTRSHRRRPRRRTLARRHDSRGARCAADRRRGPAARRRRPAAAGGERAGSVDRRRAAPVAGQRRSARLSTCSIGRRSNGPRLRRPPSRGCGCGEARPCS